MKRTIVVPLDRSEVAESALPFAVSLAKKIDADITLLAVIDVPYEFAAWLEASTIIDAKIDVEDAYADYLEVMAESIDGVDVETVVRSGNAAAEIQKFVEGLGDPIVVMASHGRSGISRMLIGSVTQQVVHRVETPVIVVPARVKEDQPTEALELNTILFPLDGSQFAEFALESALILLGDDRPRLHLLRVVEVVSWYGAAYTNKDYEGLNPYIDASRELAENYLGMMAKSLQERGYEVTTEVAVGMVSDQIEIAANNQAADMVVMATHGRSGVGRLIFGSVAERTLRQTPAPLMLVRPDPDISDIPDDLTDTLVAIRT
jgi:nucleotide-binding universal stress UspA family protein